METSASGQVTGCTRRGGHNLCKVSWGKKKKDIHIHEFAAIFKHFVASSNSSITAVTSTSDL